MTESTSRVAVVVGYACNTAEAEAAVAEVTATGGRATAVQADVADETAVAALFDIDERVHGGVDVVVHAAGQMRLAPVADLDLADLDAVLRTNVRGSFVVAQQAVRRLRPGGALVLFSNTVLGRPLPGYGARVSIGGGTRDDGTPSTLADQGLPQGLTFLTEEVKGSVEARVEQARLDGEPFTGIVAGALVVIATAPLPPPRQPGEVSWVEVTVGAPRVTGVGP